MSEALLNGDWVFIVSVLIEMLDFLLISRLSCYREDEGLEMIVRLDCIENIDAHRDKTEPKAIESYVSYGLLENTEFKVPCHMTRYFES